jgi:glycerophosphoryl diester phosphodiesterase
VSASPLFDPAARLVIAHRGNKIAVPENTLEALASAVDAGADALEFDVRCTRDGVPVLMHDETLDRTTSGSGRVASMTLAELHTLDAAARAPTRGKGQLRIPTLEEALDRFRATPLVIEVKEMAAADATERLIRKFGLHERVLIGSVENDVVERFYRSGLRTCASMRDAALLIPLAIAGLTPSKPQYDVLSLTPVYSGLPIPVTRMAAAAKRVGVPTQLWTVNDPAAARSYWDAGVAGIVTDDPAAMIRARQG